jgi:hypothetical protein
MWIMQFGALIQNRQINLCLYGHTGAIEKGGTAQ